MNIHAPVSIRLHLQHRGLRAIVIVHIPYSTTEWKGTLKIQITWFVTDEMKKNDLTHLNLFFLKVDEQFSRFLSRHHTMKIDRHDSEHIADVLGHF